MKTRLLRFQKIKGHLCKEKLSPTWCAQSERPFSSHASQGILSELLLVSIIMLGSIWGDCWGGCEGSQSWGSSGRGQHGPGPLPSSPSGHTHGRHSCQSPARFKCLVFWGFYSNIKKISYPPLFSVMGILQRHEKRTKAYQALFQQKSINEMVNFGQWGVMIFPTIYKLIFLFTIPAITSHSCLFWELFSKL